MSGRTLFLTPEEYARLKEKYPKFNEPWAEDEDEELRKMAGDGIPLLQMAEQLQRSQNSVRLRLQKLGLTMDGRQILVDLFMLASVDEWQTVCVFDGPEYAPIKIPG